MNSKNFKTIMVASFLAIIAVAGIGFAAFTTTLAINGTATVKRAAWDIHFADLEGPTTLGSAQQITAPAITTDAHGNAAAALGNFKANLHAPGDSISYRFKLANNGTFDATLTTLTKATTPTCTGTGANATTDAANVCKYLTYTLKYATTGVDVAEGQALNSGATPQVILTLAYSASVPENELPTNDVEITGLDISMLFTQNATGGSI